MISTPVILTLLFALFLLGVKWMIDLIRESPRRKSLSRHHNGWHSRRLLV